MHNDMSLFIQETLSDCLEYKERTLDSLIQIEKPIRPIDRVAHSSIVNFRKLLPNCDEVRNLY